MKHSSSSASLALALVAAPALLQACGGAAAEGARAPESKTEAEPATIEEAQARIASARAELAQAGGISPGGGGSTATGAAADSAAPKTAPAEPAAPPPPPAPGPAPAKAGAPRPMTPSAKPASESALGGAHVEDRCASPCRALESMRRAVSALCRMTGGDDARCVDAKKTLSESEGRVSPCSC